MMTRVELVSLASESQHRLCRHIQEIYAALAETPSWLPPAFAKRPASPGGCGQSAGVGKSVSHLTTAIRQFPQCKQWDAIDPVKSVDQVCVLKSCKQYTPMKAC